MEPSYEEETRTRMKVFLFNPPGDRLYLRDYYCSSISKSGYYWQPIDLLVMSGILSDDGFCLAVLDAIAQGKTPDHCLSFIRTFDPDVIIFLTGATSWASDVQFLGALVREKARRMLGCGEVFLGTCSEMFEKEPWLEAGIVDFTDRGIADYLKSKRDTPGIITLASLRYQPPRKRLASRASPAEFSYGTPRYDLFPLKRYHYPLHKYHPFASVLTTFGCPSHCAFCNSGSLGFKVRRLDDIERELRFVGAMGIRQLFVKDMSFGADRSHALAFCRLLELLSFKFSWNCYARIDAVDEELLAKMKRTGCHLIQFGVETGDAAISKRMGKPFSESLITKTFLRCRRLGIRSGAHFVLGLPDENVTSIRKGIELAVRLDPDYVSFNIFMPRYGSSLMRTFERNGLYPSAAHTRLDPSETFPPARWSRVSPKEVYRLRQRAYRVFYLRPWYLLRQMTRIRTYYEFRSLVRNGYGLIKNQLQQRWRPDIQFYYRKRYGS